MKAEIYYSESNKRETVMRSERKYIIPTSPLTMINWWRVVLDEAQMVETPNNNCSKMVKSLPGELSIYCKIIRSALKSSLNHQQPFIDGQSLGLPSKNPSIICTVCCTSWTLNRLPIFTFGRIWLLRSIKVTWNHWSINVLRISCGARVK